MRAVQISFYEWNGLTLGRWVGLANYQALLHDDLFWTALRNNAILAVVLPTITIVLALARPQTD